MLTTKRRVKNIIKQRFPSLKDLPIVLLVWKNALKLSCPHVRDKAPCPLFCHSAVYVGTDGKKRHFVFVSGDSPFRNTEQSQGQSTRVNRLQICVDVCVRVWVLMMEVQCATTNQSLVL